MLFLWATLLVWWRWATAVPLPSPQSSISSSSCPTTGAPIDDRRGCGVGSGGVGRGDCVLRKRKMWIIEWVQCGGCLFVCVCLFVCLFVCLCLCLFVCLCAVRSCEESFCYGGVEGAGVREKREDDSQCVWTARGDLSTGAKEEREGVGRAAVTSKSECIEATYWE